MLSEPRPKRKRDCSGGQGEGERKAEQGAGCGASGGARGGASSGDFISSSSVQGEFLFSGSTKAVLCLVVVPCSCSFLFSCGVASRLVLSSPRSVSGGVARKGSVLPRPGGFQ